MAGAQGKKPIPKGISFGGCLKKVELVDRSKSIKGPEAEDDFTDDVLSVEGAHVAAVLGHDAVIPDQVVFPFRDGDGKEGVLVSICGKAWRGLGQVLEEAVVGVDGLQFVLLEGSLVLVQVGLIDLLAIDFEGVVAKFQAVAWHPNHPFDDPFGDPSILFFGNHDIKTINRCYLEDKEAIIGGQSGVHGVAIYLDIDPDEDPREEDEGHKEEGCPPFFQKCFHCLSFPCQKSLSLLGILEVELSHLAEACQAVGGKQLAGDLIRSRSSPAR